MITTGGTMVTPQQLRELREYAAAPTTTQININAATTLLELLDEAIKLAAKAMTGGNICVEDNKRLADLCRLIGHVP